VDYEGYKGYIQITQNVTQGYDLTQIHLCSLSEERGVVFQFSHWVYLSKRRDKTGSVSGLFSGFFGLTMINCNRFS